MNLPTILSMPICTTLNPKNLVSRKVDCATLLRYEGEDGGIKAPHLLNSLGIVTFALQIFLSRKFFTYSNNIKCNNAIEVGGCEKNGTVGW